MNKTHDYTQQMWGHAVTITEVKDGGKQARCYGFGHGVSKGDYILLANGSYSTRYQVETIEHKSDPSDMWFADLVFAPRQEPQPKLPKSQFSIL